MFAYQYLSMLLYRTDKNVLSVIRVRPSSFTLTMFAQP